MPKSSRKPRELSGQAYALRYHREKAAQQRRYCDALALWRSCAVKACRRAQACRGDANECLKRALNAVPRRVQSRARQDILDMTPRSVGGPERAARLQWPEDLYRETTAALVEDYLRRAARLKTARREGKFILCL